MDTPIVPSNTQFNSQVYEPAEDSFLMLDALEEDLPKWLPTFPADPNNVLCLEVGTGSGIVATALANYSLPNSTSAETSSTTTSSSSKKIAPLVFALDVNPSACSLAQATAEVNRVGPRLEPLLMDGTTPSFRLPIFDLVVCNPPYVPVMPDEKFELSGALVETYLEKSWDGGPDGNAFIIPFLKTVTQLLSPHGALYLLLSSWNEPDTLMETVAKAQGFKGVCVVRRQAGRERLSVWRLSRFKVAADEGALVAELN